MSALHYAIKQGDIEAVNLFLASGADPNSRDGNFTALTHAANCNRIEIAEVLLNFGAKVDLAIDKEYFPIYYAAKSGNGAFINLLVQFGAKLDRVNTDVTSRYPITPLHIACAAGNYEAVLALIDNRARIDGFVNLQIKEPTNLGLNDATPLDWAIWKLTYQENPQNLDLITFLVENGATRRVIHLYSHGARDFIHCPVISKYLMSLGIFDY